MAKHLLSTYCSVNLMPVTHSVELISRLKSRWQGDVRGWVGLTSLTSQAVDLSEAGHAKPYDFLIRIHHFPVFVCIDNTYAERHDAHVSLQLESQLLTPGTLISTPLGSCSSSIATTAPGSPRHALQLRSGQHVVEIDIGPVLQRVDSGHMKKTVRHISRIFILSPKICLCGWIPGTQQRKI